MIQEAIHKVLSGHNISSSTMSSAMEEILTGHAQTQEIIDFLSGLSSKGETVEELGAAVAVMRRHVARIHTRHEVILDTCGTGGDTKGTFNISTAAAFVASACGITVAKHGNRSVSSICGSADILEELGIDINMDKTKIERCLDEIGIAFLFAQNLHPAMKYAMPARKAIGKRTMFNILGPLSNPAAATHQLVGVYDKRWTEPVARVLLNLGTKHALVVHGEDGLDEITTTANTFVAEARHGKVECFEISPHDFKIKKAHLTDLLGGNAKQNAEILMEVLTGKHGPKRDIVLLNAASSIYAADKVGSIAEGMDLAVKAIDSQEALKKFELLKEYSRK